MQARMWVKRANTKYSFSYNFARCWIVRLSNKFVTLRSLSPVYTIQPVVKPVVSPVWQPVKCLYTRYNRLSNRLSYRFDNRLYRVYKHSTGLTTGLTTGCIVYTAGCQTGCITRFDNRLNKQWLFVQHGCQTDCQTGLRTGLTTAWMFVFTRYSRLSNRLYNRFDNRLYRVNGVLEIPSYLTSRALWAAGHSRTNRSRSDIRVDYGEQKL